MSIEKETEGDMIPRQSRPDDNLDLSEVDERLKRAKVRAQEILYQVLDYDPSQFDLARNQLKDRPREEIANIVLGASDEDLKTEKEREKIRAAADILLYPDAV